MQASAKVSRPEGSSRMTNRNAAGAERGRSASLAPTHHQRKRVLAVVNATQTATAFCSAGTKAALTDANRIRAVKTVMITVLRTQGLEAAHLKTGVVWAGMIRVAVGAAASTSVSSVHTHAKTKST